MIDGYTCAEIRAQRNAERRGLRVAYTRAILVRDPA
jgi:hypothetical protein